MQQSVTRRGVLVGGLALASTALAGCNAGPTSVKSAKAAGGKVAGAKAAGGKAVGGKAAGGKFAHPGMLHTAGDFARMKAQVNAKAEPWTAGWNRLVANPHSASSWKPRPLAVVVRGGTGENYGTLYNDVHAAYQNALRWKVTGDPAHGNAARDILNAWSGTLTTINGTSDKFLAAGIYGYQFANAAELMRDYPGFDLARAKRLMLNVFYPMNNAFLTKHNGTVDTHYWANWDLCNMASALAIGIFCDDHAKVSQAISYFQHGAGNGALRNAVPFVYSDGLGQWQESGRDQGHSTLGIGLMGAFCEMAWNQGYDLYGYDDNRFLKGCEYVAKYNLGQSVPFTTYTWKYGGRPSQEQVITQISPGSRGNTRPIWELVYNHYVGRRGLHAPYTTEYAAKARAEGGGGDYGPNSGGFDQLGFGTLTFTRRPARH